MSGLGTQRGQATIDYLALIAVLALLLTGTAALAGGGAPGVTNAVLGQVRRALCIVSGRACAADRRKPCVVAGERDSHHVALSVAIVRLDGDRYVLRERLSDGSVRLTLAQRSAAGAEAAAGGRLRVSLKGHEIGFHREARGAAQGVLGYGEVHIARDDREAGEILRAIGRRILPFGGDGPRPREVVVEGGIRALGQVGVGPEAAGLAFDGEAGAMLGAGRDQRSGEVTISLSAAGSGSALLAAILAGPAGGFDRQVSLGLRLDRRGRPIELSLSASGMLASGAALPPGLVQVLGLGASTELSARRWELAARVDLSDPDVANAWAAFRRDPASPAAIRALGERLRAEGHLDVRSYAVRSHSDGMAAGLALGLKLGGEFDHTTEQSRLLKAATRPPGGLWEQRADCVAG